MEEIKLNPAERELLKSFEKALDDNIKLYEKSIKYKDLLLRIVRILKYDLKQKERIVYERDAVEILEMIAKTMEELGEGEDNANN